VRVCGSYLWLGEDFYTTAAAAIVMRWVLFAGVALLFVLAACAPAAPTCAPPYTADGDTCCLDKDNDTACDTPSAPDGPTLDCSLCPPQFVTQVEEKIVYKYVCPDGSVHDAKDACPQGVPSNADLFSPNDAQDESIITAFTARPACRGEHKAAELHIVLARTPQRAVIFAQSDPNGTFAEIGAIEGSSTVIDDEYYYIGFCDSADCASVTDAQLPADTASVVRAVLAYPEGNVTTRDRLLDPTSEGEYGKKKC